MRALFNLSLVSLVVWGMCLSTGIATIANAQESTYRSMQISIPDSTNPNNLVNYNEFYADEVAAPTPKDTAPSTVVQTSPAGEICCLSCNPHWVVGVEAVWLSPIQNDREVSYTILNGTTVVDQFTSAGSEVNGFYMTPRIWLGFQGECWGVQTRYWTMDEGKEEYPSCIQALGYYSSSEFKAQTVDVELTRKVCWRDTNNIISFGVRYAELYQGTNLSATEIIGGNIYSNSIQSRHSISGPGLTMALTGLKPTSCHNMNLFYSFRGSMIFDDRATNFVDSRWGYDANTIYGVASHCSPANLFIGEIQLGAQWNFKLCHNCADAFFRVGMEYQYWKTNDSGESLLNADVVGNLTGRAYGYSSDAQVSLIGLNIGTGFTW